MKLAELYKILEKDGWYIKKTKKHHLYIHPTKKGKIPLGKHRSHDVPKVTLHGILNKAGINLP